MPVRSHGQTLPCHRERLRVLLDPFFGAVRLISAAIPAALGAQGTFVGLNNIVSQSVPHLHAHVVPRTRGDGLRGFFWPRHRYESDEEAAGYADRIRAVIDAHSAGQELLSQERKATECTPAYPGRYG